MNLCKRCDWLTLGAVQMLLAALGTNGSAQPASEPGAPSPLTMEARYTAVPVKIDGVLDDPVWTGAPAYPLTLGEDRIARDGADIGTPVSESSSAPKGADGLLDDDILGLAGGAPLADRQEPITRQTDVRERGEVRLAWDDANLYVAARFQDSDIVATGAADQLHHYQLGDVLELFIKPDGQPGYWELYATPSGLETSFWQPGPQAMDCVVRDCGLRVAARCEGTLNQRQDSDTCWSVELAIPFVRLLPEASVSCRVLVARYNYSSHLPWTELSMVPRLSKTDFHLCGEYAVLKLAR